MIFRSQLNCVVLKTNQKFILKKIGKYLCFPIKIYFCSMFFHGYWRSMSKYIVGSIEACLKMLWISQLLLYYVILCFTSHPEWNWNQYLTKSNFKENKYFRSTSNDFISNRKILLMLCTLYQPTICIPSYHML